MPGVTGRRVRRRGRKRPHRDQDAQAAPSDEFTIPEIVELLIWMSFEYAGQLFGCLIADESATEEEKTRSRPRSPSTTAGATPIPSRRPLHRMTKPDRRQRAASGFGGSSSRRSDACGVVVSPPRTSSAAALDRPAAAAGAIRAVLIGQKLILWPQSARIGRKLRESDGLPTESGSRRFRLQSGHSWARGAIASHARGR